MGFTGRGVQHQTRAIAATREKGGGATEEMQRRGGEEGQQPNTVLNFRGKFQRRSFSRLCRRTGQCCEMACSTWFAQDAIHAPDASTAVLGAAKRCRGAEVCSIPRFEK